MGSIRSLGAELVALSPQTAEKSAALIGQKKLDFDVLHDRGNQVALELGLRFRLPDDLRQLYLDFGIDLESVNGEGSWTLAMPARYIVDPTGTVRYARVHPDYTRRPEPEETLAALSDLQGKG